MVMEGGDHYTTAGPPRRPPEPPAATASCAAPQGKVDNAAGAHYIGRLAMSESDPEQDQPSFNPRGRRLCPDGECVGLVGPDGHCRVCGTFDDGAAAALAAPGVGASVFAGGCATDDDSDADGQVRVEDMDSGHNIGEHDLLVADGAGGFDPGRRLCAEGSCVGVIGADGRCKECGREAAAADAAVG